VEDKPSNQCGDEKYYKEGEKKEERRILKRCETEEKNTLKCRQLNFRSHRVKGS